MLRIRGSAADLRHVRRQATAYKLSVEDGRLTVVGDNSQALVDYRIMCEDTDIILEFGPPTGQLAHTGLR